MNNDCVYPANAANQVPFQGEQGDLMNGMAPAPAPAPGQPANMMQYQPANMMQYQVPAPLGQDPNSMGQHDYHFHMAVHEAFIRGIKAGHNYVREETSREIIRRRTVLGMAITLPGGEEAQHSDESIITAIRVYCNRLRDANLANAPSRAETGLMDIAIPGDLCYQHPTLSPSCPAQIPLSAGVPMVNYSAQNPEYQPPTQADNGNHNGFIQQ